MKQLFTYAVSTIALVSNKTATDVGPDCVVAKSVRITLICFRVCTFIDICN